MIVGWIFRLPNGTPIIVKAHTLHEAREIFQACYAPTMGEAKTVRLEC